MSDPSERPRFTVVVPALDEAAYLPATLESLRRQDFRGVVEVIVVDNGSRDATVEIARDWGAQVVHEPVPGVCAARQRGTTSARGQIVVSTDADTRHPVGWLARIDEQFDRHPYAVAVAGPCTYVDAPWWAAVVPPLWFGAIGRLYEHTGRVAYLTATNVAYRREGFPGYDVALTQGGDEADLLRRLQGWGAVVWDGGNTVSTSSRRLDQGLAYTLLVSYGYYYAASMLLGRLVSRRVIGVAPAIRVEDGNRVRRRRVRWRTASVTALVVVTALGVRSRLARTAPSRVDRGR